MKKSDVTNIYTMEELIVIVGKLAKQYTSGESTSITYERARQFMEAVIYCISHIKTKNNSLINSIVLPAEEAYQIGYNSVIEKVKETQKKYKKLMKFFDHYGNQNYKDTIEKALPGFFLYYDARFLPMDNIITMDYPVFGLDMNLEGIDIIRQYIDSIWSEQCYLMKFPKNYIISELRSFHPKYEKEYFNIKEIIELSIKKKDEYFVPYPENLNS